MQWRDAGPAQRQMTDSCVHGIAGVEMSELSEDQTSQSTRDRGRTGIPRAYQLGNLFRVKLCYVLDKDHVEPAGVG